jgi:type IV pilus biogenesis protein CpaD/CtpE
MTLMNKHTYVVIVLLSFLTLTGCYEQHVNVPGGPWVLDVKRHSHSKTMGFKGTQVKLSSNQKHHIQSLVAQAAMPGPVYARIAANALTIDDITQGRIDALTEYLKKIGIHSQRIDVICRPPAMMISKGSAYQNTLIVSIDQYQVCAPDCPGWEPMDTLSYPEGEKNYGCTTINNLALMVAEPKDLYDGQALALGDGPREAYFIKMYREDKIKPLISESYLAGSNTSNSNTATSSSSNGGTSISGSGF